MESSRAQWTDARLDDLAERVTELDHRLTSQIDTRFNSLDAKFDAKFDRLQQTLLGSMATVVLAFALQAVFGG
jgi:superoxide dismutase